MRSIGLLAVLTGTLLMAFACTDGGEPGNEAPVASFDLPTCAVDVSCEFISKSSDDVAVTAWSWDFNGDGTSEAETETASTTYKAAGDFNVILKVWDAQGLSHTKTRTITVAPNTPPTADFTHSCNAADCTFISTSTDVAPGAIATYEWTFGDGATADVNNPSHRYTLDASTDFTVTLTVTDNGGATAVVTKTITVTPYTSGNPPPTASFAHACNAAICTFASTSTDAPPGTIVTYAWRFGDGATAEVKNPSHSYVVTLPTDFTVTLTVTDNEGATAVATKTITITPVPTGNGPPTAGFTHACNAANCTFVSTSTDVAPGTIVAYAWTFGDGGTAVLSNPSHTYTIDATTDFTVTLTVTDNEGGTAIVTKTITVTPAVSGNTPPTASFTPWCYGEGCIFTSTSTDVAPGTILSYAWTFGDGATAEWNNWTYPQHVGTHVYSIGARTSFTVTLTVTDNEGATAVTSRTVTVSPLPPAVQGCTTSGNNVECVLDIPARSTLKLKLLEVHCDLRHFDRSRLTTPPPVGDQVFLSVCSLPVGRESGVFGGTMDELWVYQAGTQARIWFTQGDARPSEPQRGPPAGQLSGTFPDWTLSFDDGDNAGAPGEPNFTDLVVGVHATVR